ncbi:MAG: DNA helicase UvrD, partial [Candidatus Bipolaricaulota bacterium]|nr:DNA helicase UvrD [Candidatus Bipolaricaulota bacterium]
MQIIADLHIHSRYSRATSPTTDLPTLARWAKIKGITLLGTGDFTHPQWYKELQEYLVPVGNGLYRYGGVL